MKKKLAILLVVVALVAMFATMAVATGPRYIRYSGGYFAGNTYIMKFDVSGFARRTSFPASFTVAQTNYPMSCSFDGLTKVTCKKTNANRFVAHSAKLWVNGSVFYTWIPLR